MDKQELQKIVEWSKKYWFITISNNILHVKKGRTKKQFKLKNYQTFEDLKTDVDYYMSHEKNYGWK